MRLELNKKYEGQGHISKLVKMAEQYAKQKGITYLTIGCEAKETLNLRNLSSLWIYTICNKFN